MLFRKKQVEKESNVATTPEREEQKARFTKIKVLFFVWNILSITLYSSYTLFITYQLASKSFLAKIIEYLLWAYAAIFLLLILLNIGSGKKMKYHLKNYKSATKFLKYAISIINFSLSIFTAISAFTTTGTTDISAILYAVLSLIVTGVLILVEIAKIIIRKNIPLIKRNFLELRDKPEPRRDDSMTINEK